MEPPQYVGGDRFGSVEVGKPARRRPGQDAAYREQAALSDGERERQAPRRKCMAQPSRGPPAAARP